MYKLKVRRLKIAAGFAVVAVILALLGVSWPPFQLLYGLPLAIILPGYALMSALFPPRSLDEAQRLLYTLALSVTIAAVSGLALNFTPWGFQARTWAVLLGTITVLGCVFGIRRIQGMEKIDTAPLGLGLDKHQKVLLSLAGLLIIGAVVVGVIGTELTQTTGYTQLWLLPVNPTTPDKLQVGLHSTETEPVTYRLQVKLADGLLKEWPSIKLAPGEKWETSFDLPPKQLETEVVEADLYRQDAPTKIYRYVTWWRTPTTVNR